MYVSEGLAQGCLILEQILLTVLSWLLYIHGWSVWWEEDFGLKFLIFPNQDDQWFLIMSRYFLFICIGDIQGVLQADCVYTSEAFTINATSGHNSYRKT